MPEWKLESVETIRTETERGNERAQVESDGELIDRFSWQDIKSNFIKAKRIKLSAPAYLCVKLGAFSSFHCGHFR
jgi:hypothetical protein